MPGQMGPDPWAPNPQERPASALRPTLETDTRPVFWILWGQSTGFCITEPEKGAGIGGTHEATGPCSPPGTPLSRGRGGVPHTPTAAQSCP